MQWVIINKRKMMSMVEPIRIFHLNHLKKKYIIKKFVDVVLQFRYNWKIIRESSIGACEWGVRF